MSGQHEPPQQPPQQPQHQQQEQGNPSTDPYQGKSPGDRGHARRDGRPRRSRSEDRRHDEYYPDPRRHREHYDQDRYSQGPPPRYRDSGYYDEAEHYYDEADYHRPLSYDRPRGARPLYRARSLPQRDFLHYDADYYPLHSGSSLPRSSSRARARRPFSNLGDYGGYDQGINTYFGHDPYTERYPRPTSSQSDYSFPELYHNNLVGKRRRHYSHDPSYEYLPSPDLPHFSSTPHHYPAHGLSAPLKPCLKRPGGYITNAHNNMFYTSNTGKTGTPSAFQPFSTISEDLVWDPYTGSSSYDLHSMGHSGDNYRLPRPTNFRSEISRFTESLYNLAKPTPIKPRGQFPRVEKYPQSGNLSSILNPGLPMKPVQNLDRINPYTGLPNIEFIPTTEYLEVGASSSYLPPGTPSPDTTARRVAAILEPTETYSDLVANFQTRKADQHSLQMLEAQMSSMNLHQPPASISLYPQYIHNNLGSSLTQTTPHNYIQTQPLPSYSSMSRAPVMTSNNMDPTFLGRAPPSLAPSGLQPQQMYLTNTPVTPGLNMNSNLLNSINPAVTHNHLFPSTNQISGQMQPTAAPAFDQSQLDQAWLQLSNDLRRQQNTSRAGLAGSQPPGHRLSSHYDDREPLQGTLDMMSIDRVTNMTRPAFTGDSGHTGPRPALTPVTPVQRSQTRSHKLEHVYDQLLSLPRMPRSPGELEPVPSSEDELTRYNERRRENLLTLMNSRRDAGNVDLRKHQLSTKYQETKYIEKRILGHVPSILADLNQMDLNKKMNDKNREMDRTLRHISRSYEDRCKQRKKMQSTLSLVKEIPKMEFDANNKLVAKETSTKLKSVKRSKEENKIKMDDIEFEANEDIMSMIYWNALKEKMETRAPRQRKRRKSKVKSFEKYCESSSDAEIGVVLKSPLLKPNAPEYLVKDCKNKVEQQLQRQNSVEKYCGSSSDAEISSIMKSHLFKQKVEDHIPEKNRDAEIKHLKRYSPRLPNKLIPLDENQSAECEESKKSDILGSNVKTKNDLVINLELNTITTSLQRTNPISDSSKLIRELKFLSSDDPVPSPAPAEGKRPIVESSDRQEIPEIEYPLLKSLSNGSKKPLKVKNMHQGIKVDMPELKRIYLETKPQELINNSKKPLAETSRFDHFRKTRSSSLFESIPEVVVEKRIEMRTNSDPLSIVEDGIIGNGMEKINLNISKTARKHLGMAVTPIDRNDDDMKNFVHALQISSDDTITKSIVSQDYRKDESLSLMSTPQITDAGFRDFAHALQISSDCTT